MDQYSNTYIRQVSVVKLKPGFEEKYENYHRNIWPYVKERIKSSGIRNYSIFLKSSYLFSYREIPVDADVKAMNEEWEKDACCQKWQEIMTSMQEPVPGVKSGDWWTDMDEVFHID